MQQPQTVAQLLLGDLADDQKGDPNARICGGPKASTLTGVPPGVMVEVICFGEAHIRDRQRRSLRSLVEARVLELQYRDLDDAESCLRTLVETGT